MAKKNLVDRCSNLNSLQGIEIVGYSVDADYWHLDVYLQTADGKAIKFFNHPTDIAKKFEVFPIDFEILSSCGRNFTGLKEPFAINTARGLWRVEWSEIGTLHPEHQGVNPVSITSGPLGTAAENCIEQCDVFAGVLLYSANDERIAVYTPTHTPLNTNIAFTASEIELTIQGFSLV